MAPTPEDRHPRKVNRVPKVKTVLVLKDGGKITVQNY